MTVTAAGSGLVTKPYILMEEIEVTGNKVVGSGAGLLSFEEVDVKVTGSTFSKNGLISINTFTSPNTSGTLT